MVRAWYMDSSDEDRRLEHHRQPPAFISMEDLYETTGVEYFKFNHENPDADELLQKLKKSRGFTYEDESSCTKKCFTEEQLLTFYEEHLHTDEEVRFILEGSGYFDVRDKSDEWIRIEVVPGDLIIIPTGIYHRFSMDLKTYVKANRFFVGEPDWTQHNRPGAESMDCRTTYLNKLRVI